MEIKELKQQIAPHAYLICSELYSNGKIENGDFKIGNTAGDDGRSLSIKLQGEMAGQWTDFETGERGDLLDLIQRVKGVDLKEAMDWSAKHCSIRTHAAAIKTPPRKEYKKPIPPKRVNSEVLHKFLEDRGFKDVGELCHKHQIYATEDLRTKGTDLVFQFFDRAGKLAFLKSKPMDYEGNPGQCNQSNLKPILYGWHSLDTSKRVVWIVEGELDQIAASEIGINALSMPSGASNMAWVEHEYHNLDQFEDIVIATDQDDAGEAGANKILKEARFGDRCFRVRFPAKDINDLVKEHGYKGAKEILDQAYDSAKWADPAQLRSVTEFVEDIDSYFEKSFDNSGFRSGWQKIDENDFRFREHELHGLTGINGHGKSMWLKQLMINVMEQGGKVCIASMEMTPKHTLGRMMCQLTGSSNPDEEHRKKALDWLSQKLWLFVDRLTPRVDDLMKCFEYAYKRYGVNVFVIDSLTNMVQQDDYSGQQKFMERLVNFKMSYPVTVFLVTHSRKGDDEGRSPNKYDVKGSGSITDLADSFMSIWKNKKKADHIEACESMNGKQRDEKIMNQWDIYLSVLKNRNGQWEGMRGFNFCNRSLQYLEQKKTTGQAYIKAPRSKGAPF